MSLRHRCPTASRLGSANQRLLWSITQPVGRNQWTFGCQRTRTGRHARTTVPRHFDLDGEWGETRHLMRAFLLFTVPANIEICSIHAENRGVGRHTPPTLSLGWFRVQDEWVNIVFSSRVVSIPLSGYLTSWKGAIFSGERCFSDNQDVKVIIQLGGGGVNDTFRILES